MNICKADILCKVSSCFCSFPGKYLYFNVPLLYIQLHYNNFDAANSVRLHEWVYNDFTTYVITHNAHTSSEKIQFTNTNPVDLVKSLKKENGKGIWICGGANLVQQLVNEDFIDCYYITIIPTLLGSGIRLFENIEHEVKLRLLHTRSYNGMTDLIYTRR